MKFKQLLFFFLFLSCKQVHEGIPIDLSDNNSTIYYSDFVDSLSYMKLNTGDSCLISGIDYMYTDSNYCIVKDLGGDGLFIFEDNQLIGHLHHYGRGPQEFIRISYFCIDKKSKQIYIHDNRSKKIVVYTYHGQFVREFPFLTVFHDFIITDDKNIICISPYYIPGTQNGIWLADSNGVFMKSLYEVTEDCQFHTSSATNYKQCGDHFIYYDRYKDLFVTFTQDSSRFLYKFDLKQGMPASMKKDPEQDFVPEYFMECGFLYTKRCMLIGFSSMDQHYWVLFDAKTEQVKISSKLVNDLDDKKELATFFGHIDDHTLIRELRSAENDCNVYLQLLHVKK